MCLFHLIVENILFQFSVVNLKILHLRVAAMEAAREADSHLQALILDLHHIPSHRQNGLVSRKAQMAFLQNANV